ncbi:ABC transporter permease [Salinigranum halophilum]|jgi:peptide/nickel transport system permease protein|uniref:ABC transporter permease n=1 Tax=Salinigranum halophilum TaxID=2565931 RepID=UPI0010A80D66|nr:ABC transporter permease [Salinigranum halophilum]
MAQDTSSSTSTSNRTQQSWQGDVSDDGVDAANQPEARVGLRYTLSQVRRDPTALLGLGIIAFMTTVALVAFVDSIVFDVLADVAFFADLGVRQYVLVEAVWINPVNDPDNAEILLPPYGLTNELYPNQPGTLAHPLGTDHRGRDILARLFYGTRIAITVGIVSTGIAMVLGTLVGAVAGYYGGRIDDALMRAAEVLFAIPFLVLVIAFMTAFGRNLTFAMVGVGIATIPTFARLIRSRVLSVREEDFVEAARAAGVRDRNIILRHVIPNSFAPVLVQATLQVGINILIIAGLSFLGYGAQPPTPSWGQMLSASRNYMLPNPWFSIWPGIAILVTVVGFNLLGDGLRDALDPRINN